MRHCGHRGRLVRLGDGYRLTTTPGQVVTVDLQTSLTGVFAIGDCRVGPPPRVGAAPGGGSLVATKIWSSFRWNPSPRPPGRNWKGGVAMSSDDFRELAQSVVAELRTGGGKPLPLAASAGLGRMVRLYEEQQEIILALSIRPTVTVNWSVIPGKLDAVKN